VGIALAGACPGTTLAQIGTGYRDAWFTLAGGLCGAVAFSYAQPSLLPLLNAGDGKLIFSDLFGIPFWAGALAWAAILVLALVVLERLRPWRDEMGRNVDGDFGPPEQKAARTPSIVPAE
jgi:hypothetical protein